MILLEVAVAAPVTGTYTYRLPESAGITFSSSPYELIGHRVIVPFGRRKITGYVLRVNQAETHERELKDISRIPDTTPLFGSQLIPLFEWISQYYHYPLGEVIKTALPGGLTTRFQKKLFLKSKSALSGYLDQSDRFGWLKVLSEKGEIGPEHTRSILTVGSHKRFAENLAKEKIIEIKSSQVGREVKKRVEQCYHLKPDLFEGDPVHSSEDKSLVINQHTANLSKAEIKLVTLLNNYQHGGINGTPMPRKELIEQYPYGGKIVQKLLNKGLVTAEERRVYRSPLGHPINHTQQNFECNDEQKEAINTINSKLKKAVFHTFLLHGVTGSGKTEVYLQCTELAVAQNKSVIILVPEIALATQVEESFVSRFGDAIALLHSGLSVGEKYDEWCRIAEGKAKIIIGARSAVFAPAQKLGLIIVDEEHDSSFKQEEGLRYQGRDVAIMRAKQFGATVVLGSATPAISSYFNSKNGKYELLELPHRVGQRRLPDVKILDLKNKDRKSTDKLFHQEFTNRLKNTLEQGNQSIVLLNKRGFSASVVCRDCGAMVECKHCKVTLTYHKSRKQLVCHYCSFTQPDMIVCSVCASNHLVPVGFGTERVEEELRLLFPDAAIARIDSDTAHHRPKFLTILQKIKQGDIDIVVGTQMISKGLHFPGVTFVGVVSADSGLSIPDYKAAERTYQLISQVTGRAGRGEVPGEVMIQTLQPDHYAIKMAAEHDYHALAEQEITIRQATGFPPFSRLVSIKIEGDSESGVSNKSTEIAQLARRWCSENQGGERIAVLGPAPCPIERLRNKFRWQLLLKSRSLKHTELLLSHLKANYFPSQGYRVIYDIDPESMM
ncbi:MAG: primosomal protein N' [Desulfobulbaceae bacterium]|nr:MAG: primosomal protein N' [Desulfobulbaceae bacterium]